MRAPVTLLGGEDTDAIDIFTTMSQRALLQRHRKLAKYEGDGQTAFRRLFVFRVHFPRRSVRCGDRRIEIDPAFFWDLLTRNAVSCPGFHCAIGAAFYVWDLNIAGAAATVYPVHNR